MDSGDCTPWYRSRGYVHFDPPLSPEEAAALVANPERVARHSFWPLLGFRRCERRWSRKGKKFKTKVRPIAYASHSDAHIFAYYAWRLGALYENRVHAAGLRDVVLAYRKHDRGDGRGKTNYHFAADAFVEILVRGECDVVTIDVAKFFDTIPHKQLKQQLRTLLGVVELPRHHFAVFKAATRFAVVPLEQVRKQLGLGHRRFRKISRLPVSGKEFRELIRENGLVNRNARPYGIPQGLPISGLLANLVMLDLDNSVNEAAIACGASYKRYSDDILLICRPGASAELEALLASKLGQLGLEIQHDKTARVEFRRAEDGALIATAPLQYLGFTFDGRRVLVRAQTVVRFLKRTAKAVTRAKNAARKAGPNKDGKFRIRRRSLYTRFSHLQPHHETSLTKLPRGTFFRYLDKASAEFDPAVARRGILVQVRRQFCGAWNRLHRFVKSAEEELNSHKTARIGGLPGL